MKQIGILFLIAMSLAIAAFAQDVVAPVEALNVPHEEIPGVLSSVMDAVSGVPVIGPIVLTIAKYLGLIASVLTILVTAILGVLRALQTALPLMKLAELAAKIAAFGGSKVMYYLKFFSMYNAKKAGSAKVDAPK